MPDKKNTHFKDLPIVIVGCLLILVVIYFVSASRGDKVAVQSGDKEIFKEEVAKKTTSEERVVSKVGEAEIIKEENKDIVEKAIKELSQASEEENSSSAGMINESDHIWGDLGAPVELLVYSDFQCPFCADFADTIKQIKEEFGDKVVVAFRHFPLRSHSQAMPAALAAECAAEQEEFWQMHDKLFEDNKDGLMSSVVFKEDAREIGLNTSQFDKCLDTGKYNDKVEEQMEAGRQDGTFGTPASFVNGESIAGAYPFEDFTHADGRAEEGMKNIISRHLEEAESNK